MPSAGWWKEFYASERISLMEHGMEALFHNAPAIELSRNGAIIFPHTKLSVSGHLIAAAARAVMESACESVLVLGVLHLGDRRDEKKFRGIHGLGAPFDKGIWRDEFSLDNFEAMLGIAARLAGKRMPTLLARYPFLTGEHPESLQGFEELVALTQQGVAIMVTADLVHHGTGYGTPEPLRLDREDSETLAWAEREIDAQLSTLLRKDFIGFLAHCETARSDFRDAGPVLASLLPLTTQSSILNVSLVNYSDVLNAEEPTWVAAALAKFD